MRANIFADGFKEQPYWWEAAPPAAEELRRLPASVDVFIVGAGLAGVATGYELAKGSRSVLAADAGIPGAGASSRNAGMVGRHFKHTFSGLHKALGLDAAKAYFGELRCVYDAAIDRIEHEGLDCDYRKCGRFVGAASKGHLRDLFEDFEQREKYLGEEVEFFEGSVQSELATTEYCGGVTICENGSIQPAKYYAAMKRRALTAGVTIAPNTTVLAIQQDKSGFTVVTSRGSVHAKDVVLATNGYSGIAKLAIGPKLSPINAFMIATEKFEPGHLEELLRHHRTYVDNRKDTPYMQLSPDRRQLLFGGLTGSMPNSLRETASRLHSKMTEMLPSMANVKLTHVWTGRCAASSDMFPHCGKIGDIHYAAGFCFSGNAMAPYLGTLVARRILGQEARSIFQTDTLSDVPWIQRQDSAVALAMRYYRFLDAVH